MADRTSVTWLDGACRDLPTRRQGTHVWRTGAEATVTVVPATPTPGRTASGCPAGKTIARIATDVSVHFAVGNASVDATTNDPIIPYAHVEYVEVDEGQYISFLKIV